LEKTGDSYSLSTTDADPNTYALKGRPWTNTGIFNTRFFVTYLIPNAYEGVLDDVAIALSDQYGAAIGKPIVVSVTRAQRYFLENNTTRYEYDISQRPSQKRISPLSTLFAVEGDSAGDINVQRSRDFYDCTLFIADTPHSQDGLGSSLSPTPTPVIPQDQAAGALSQVADALAAQADNANNAQLSAYEKFLKEKNVVLTSQSNKAGDIIKNGALSINALATFINQCLVGSCDFKTGLNDAGNVIFAVSMLIGTTFP